MTNKEFEQDLIKRLKKEIKYLELKLKDCRNYEKECIIKSQISYKKGQIKYYIENPLWV